MSPDTRRQTPARLLQSFDNPQFSAVRILFQRYLIPHEDLDTMDAHFPRKVRKDLLAAFYGNAEHRVGQCFVNCACQHSAFLLLITHFQEGLKILAEGHREVNPVLAKTRHGLD